MFLILNLSESEKATASSAVCNYVHVSNERNVSCWCTQWRDMNELLYYRKEIRSGHFIADSQSVCLSVRLGLEPLIATHGHILAWKKISILSFVGRPPWRVVGTAMYGSHSLFLCCVHVHTHVWMSITINTEEMFALSEFCVMESVGRRPGCLFFF
jgi:hypothetical protein